MLGRDRNVVKTRCDSSPPLFRREDKKWQAKADTSKRHLKTVEIGKMIWYVIVAPAAPLLPEPLPAGTGPVHVLS
jgi:hypothetical protein